MLAFPAARTWRHRGQGVLEDSAVYLLQRGHFALAMGWAITLYEDCSQMSPPVKESVIAEREAEAVGKTQAMNNPVL